IYQLRRPPALFSPWRKYRAAGRSPTLGAPGLLEPVPTTSPREAPVPQTSPESSDPLQGGWPRNSPGAELGRGVSQAPLKHQEEALALALECWFGVLLGQHVDTVPLSVNHPEISEVWEVNQGAEEPWPPLSGSVTAP
ncbi:hypothetical protein P7K49_004345, partial [Saguinus oedipus]